MNKGKLKVFYQILMAGVIMLTAAVCVFLSCVQFGVKKGEQAFSATIIGQDEYSSVDTNHLIFSAEKVAVISTDDSLQSTAKESNTASTSRYLAFQKELTLGGSTLTKMLTYGDNYYYFYYLGGARNNDYVIEDGEFVMLENSIDDNGYYYIKNQDPATATDGSGSYNLAEAVLVSFGQYVYNSETSTASLNTDSSTGANIQYVNILLYRNGTLVSDSDINPLPQVRQYYNNNYQDFTYIIPQVEGNDGYYTFSITYRYADVLYSQSFSFYLLYQTSYTGDMTTDDGNTYCAQPTMTLSSGSTLSTDSNGTYRYYLGETNADYPTLVFDYTRYSLSYTRTANGTTTSVTYTLNTTTGSSTGKVTAGLLCTSTTSGVTTTTTYILDNYSSSGNNLVVIMFTEMGNYNFKFEYLYSGYNASSAPEMNLTVSDINLSIHGFQLNYSKSGYDSAQMSYILVSSNESDGVDLIIPDGYQKGTSPSQSDLGVMYAYDDTSTARVGKVVSSQDTSINLALTNGYYDDLIKLFSVIYNYAGTAATIDSTTYSASGYTTNSISDIISFLSGSITYQKTNQGSLWLESNDSFEITDSATSETGSFYLYCKSAPVSLMLGDDDVLTLGSGTSIKKYTNTVSFNQVGYYLVFVKVSDSSNTKDDYYQIFAFQYTSDTQSVNVNLMTYDSNGDIVYDTDGNPVLGSVVGSGGYTNQNVVISWTEPALFESEISVYYYRQIGSYLTLSELTSTTAYALSNYQILGAEIADGKGATYLIYLSAAGKSGSYRTFTIDREAISGVKAYAVEAMSVNDSLSSGSTIIYQLKTTTSGNSSTYIELSSAITDTLATLYWDYKASGAAITTSYTYTPFYKTSSVTVGSVYTSSTQTWYTTNYTLGNTSGSISVSRASSLGSDIDAGNVLQKQGIYVFTLTDAAGNSCKYILVIDNTSAYFLVDDGDDQAYYNASSLTFSTDVDITVSTHKAIQLTSTDATSTDTNTSELYAFITALSNSNTTTAYNAAVALGYFEEGDTNLSNLITLFSSIGSGSDGYNYLIVKNLSVSTYTDQSAYDSSLSLSSISTTDLSKNTINMAYVETTSTSMIRYYYLLGANQSASGTAALDSSSYITIEINKDKSQGKVYYSNDTLSLDIINAGNATRLVTGSDTTSGELGISGAHATSDSFLGFTWLFGTGNFEIESITYSYYTLVLSESSYTSNYYYYDTSSVISDQNIYSKTSGYGSGASGTSSMGFVLINVSNSLTQAGLYVITRTYSGDSSEISQTGDKKVQTYYFIVDRNGIIDTSNAINGGYIFIGLLEDETSFNSFSSYGNTSGTLVYTSTTGTTVSTTTESYLLYLETNKLPATMNVTTAKYFSGTYGSDYYSGKLTFSLYFVDTYSQLSGNYAGTKGLLLFEISAEDLTEAGYYKDGYYIIDISALINSNLRSLFINSSNDTDWLCLPGDYVLVISDLVECSNNNDLHKKVIGMRISYDNTISAGPTTDVYSVISSSYTVSNSYNKASINLNEGAYTLTTSEEFVKVELAAYDTTATSAGVDIDYLIVKQYLNDNASTYIDYEYKNLNGSWDLGTESSVVVFNADGSKTVYLNTLLRDNSGQINASNLDDELYYVITIRYKLSNSNYTSNTRYINAYYYYVNGVKYTYYEQTYIVYIDRIAPTDNVDALISADTLVGYYVSDTGVDSLNENSYYELASGIYFVNQYTAYYADTSDISTIYALRITSSTKFDNSDVDRVYYRIISDTSSINLSLPVTNTSTYQAVSASNISLVTNYGELLSSCSAGQYVEILEMDEAGNTTQYVVFYDGTDGNFQYLSFNFAVTTLESSTIKSKTATISTQNDTTSYLTIFAITAADVEFNGTGSDFDRFLRVQLVNTVTYSTAYYLTSFDTNFSNTTLTQSIVNMLTTAGFGNYTLNINTRYSTRTLTINYYDVDSQVQLNIDSLVRVSSGVYSIDLKGANTTQNSIVYYAQVIVVTDPSGTETVYVCDPSDNYNYYLGQYSEGEYVKTEAATAIRYLTELASGTYQLYAIDAFGNEYTSVFNTKGEVYYSISFDSISGDAAYYYFNDTYYGFTAATIYFDVSLYSVSVSYMIEGSISQTTFDITSANISTINSIPYNSTYIIDLTNIESGYIVLNPYLGTNNLGSVFSVTVTLSVGNNGISSYNHTYSVVIDSTTGSVSLKDNATATSQSMDLDTNIVYSSDGTGLPTESASVTSGSMTLSWSKYTNSYFVYYYTLYELLNTGFTATDLTSETYASINTGSDSTGIYSFVISIYTIEGNYLGNKVYTFSVQPSSTLLYYVWDGSDVIASNATFTFAEIIDAGIATENYLLTRLEVSTLSTTNIPLYISTKTLALSVSSKQGVSSLSLQCVSNSTYTFTIYKIYTSTYNMYIGTLIMSTTSTLVSNITLSIGSSTSTSITGTSTLSYTVSGSADDKAALTFNQVLDVSNVLTKKNGIILDVYYNNEYVTSVDTQSAGGSASYLIQGNGTYSFVFRDLAGNTHTFSYYNGTTLDITVLREIPVTMNGMSVVDYAYFNGTVILTISSPATYDLGTISLSATLNGSRYYPSTSSYSYSFSGYGTYRVVVSASYNGLSLSRVIIFTIINENEARTSIDFTSISNYTITKVTNSNNRDVTSSFLAILNSTSSNAMLVDYDTLLANGSALGVSSGKQSFTMTYQVEDTIYPTREISFTFTMNNEIPTIESTVEAGDSTTKGFTITYNAGIIYEQVGDSYLYINDILVAVITSSSASALSTYTITEDANGAGDYYVKLVSSSGSIITSFKVTVNEPLNTWSIIIIVVVSGIVLAVVISIIVLRKKMRIR